MEYPCRSDMLVYIERVLPDVGARLKRLLDKESFLRHGNAYGEGYADRQIELCFDAIFRHEYLRCRIVECTTGQMRSVKELAELLGLDPKEVLKEVVELRRKNLLNIETIKDRTPLYKAAR